MSLGGKLRNGYTAEEPLKFVVPDGRMGGVPATCYMVSVALHQTDGVVLVFFLPFFFKVSLKSSYSSLLFFFFFFVLAVGATEERPEPSLKMYFFLF